MNSVCYDLTLQGDRPNQCDRDNYQFMQTKVLNQKYNFLTWF